MIRRRVLLPAALACVCLSAAGRVAPGFVDWSGAVDKNHIAGRYISDSDLRHRFTVIVEFEPDKACEQLSGPVGGQIASLDNLNLTGPVEEPRAWDNPLYRRDCFVVYVSRGKKQVRQVAKALEAKARDEDHQWRATYFSPVYEGITCPGAPKDGGKFPFVWVMPPTGNEPIFTGTCDGTKTEWDIRSAIDAWMKKNGRPQKSRPFYGLCAEPKYFPQLGKALRGGKSLQPVLKACAEGIKSPDADKAREAQLLYDGIEQTRGDMGYRIVRNVNTATFCVIDDIRRLHRYWPTLPTHLGETEKLLMTDYPRQLMLADIYGTVIDCEAYCDEWSAGEIASARAAIKKAMGKVQRLMKDEEHPVELGFAAAFKSVLEGLECRLVARASGAGGGSGK